MRGIKIKYTVRVKVIFHQLANINCDNTLTVKVKAFLNR